MKTITVNPGWGESAQMFASNYPLAAFGLGVAGLAALAYIFRDWF